jgi:4-carboxymuconolactone decarboxylase
MNKEKYEAGMKVRREVLGDAYVDKAATDASAFGRPLQELVAENVWGSVWVRDGLDKRTRSLVTIATLVALRASVELKIHVRGALRNGCRVEEIREVLLHATAYCGFPAAIEAFRAAREVIESWQAERSGDK